METKKSPAAQSIEDKLNSNRALRDVRREMGKFSLDTTKVSLSLRRGTLLLVGKFAPLSGKEEIFEDEKKALIKSLQSLPEVNNVVCQ
jgi:hypothetical protein